MMFVATPLCPALPAAAYRIPELVADVVALIYAHGGGPAHAVGHDWSAAVAWALIAGRPEKVRSLTAPDC